MLAVLNEPVLTENYRRIRLAGVPQTLSEGISELLNLPHIDRPILGVSGFQQALAECRSETTNSLQNI
jgi:hypothetical protein